LFLFYFSNLSIKWVKQFLLFFIYKSNEILYKANDFEFCIISNNEFEKERK
jgi:hypothetical protein